MVGAISYPNAIAWSDENLIAVASGHLVTILVLNCHLLPSIRFDSSLPFPLTVSMHFVLQNPALPLTPRGLVTISTAEPFSVGIVDRNGILFKTTI